MVWRTNSDIGLGNEIFIVSIFMAGTYIYCHSLATNNFGRTVLNCATQILFVIDEFPICAKLSLLNLDFIQWLQPNPVFSTKCLVASGGWTRKVCRLSSSGLRANAVFSKRSSTRSRTACWSWTKTGA